MKGGVAGQSSVLSQDTSSQDCLPCNLLSWPDVCVLGRSPEGTHARSELGPVACDKIDARAYITV